MFLAQSLWGSTLVMLDRFIMREFEIEVVKSVDAKPSAAAGFAIRSGATIFTRLIRQESSAPRYHLWALGTQPPIRDYHGRPYHRPRLGAAKTSPGFQA